MIRQLYNTYFDFGLFTYQEVRSILKWSTLVKFFLWAAGILLLTPTISCGLR